MAARYFLAALAVLLVTACGNGGDTATEQSSADEASAEQTAAKAESATAGESQDRAATGQEAGDGAAEPGSTAAAIRAALKGDHRGDKQRARDRFRHPLETLQFFGLEPDMTVVEMWPGGGWYTAVLAPVLDEEGQLIAAGFDKSYTDQPRYRIRIQMAYEKQLSKNPDVYGNVKVIPFNPPKSTSLGEPGSADMVLTFRNLHNWVNDDIERDVFAAAYEVLEPGGVLGVVQHRADDDADPKVSAEDGYVPEPYVRKIARDAGFELVASSDVNANPDDTHDHPEGVWTLPPSYRLCEQYAQEARSKEGEAEALEEKAAECRDKYKAIGESDRMTLKFVKPEA